LDNKKVLIGIAIIVIVLVIAYSSLSQFLSPYKYVWEVKEDSKYSSEPVYVAGLIVDGSFRQVSDNPKVYEFDLTDGKMNMHVVYEGDLPAAFDPSQGCVVYGTIGPDGTFKAVKLLAKCPSKYQEKIRERAGE